VDWLRRWKYRALLLALLFLVVVYPTLRGLVVTQLVYDLLMAVVLLAALFAVFTPRSRLLAVALGAPALFGLWTGYLLPELPRLPVVVSFHAAAVLFLAFTVVTILREVHLRERVDADGVYGAMIGYLLIGLLFGHLYCILEVATPGSFHASGEVLDQIRDEGHAHFQLTYFSFSTLTTAGYGDIAPVKAGARGLAVVEAMVGQFYVAVLLGELIGKKVAHALAERRPGPKEP
jgi:Ion channel